MQGQRRPCQDSICSMPACLWPGATASGHGGVLETLCLLAEFALKMCSLERKEMAHFLGAKKFLCVPLGGERRDKTQCMLACGNLDGTANGRLSVVPSSKAKWLIHFCSTPSTIVWTHTCSIVRDCLPWAEVTDFSFTDLLTMGASGSLQASFQQWSGGPCFSETTVET